MLDELRESLHYISVPAVVSKAGDTAGSNHVAMQFSCDSLQILIITNICQMFGLVYQFGCVVVQTKLTKLLVC